MKIKTENELRATKLLLEKKLERLNKTLFLIKFRKDAKNQKKHQNFSN